MASPPGSSCQLMRTRPGSQGPEAVHTTSSPGGPPQNRRADRFLVELDTGEPQRSWIDPSAPNAVDGLAAPSLAAPGVAFRLRSRCAHLVQVGRIARRMKEQHG